MATRPRVQGGPVTFFKLEVRQRGAIDMVGLGMCATFHAVHISVKVRDLGAGLEDIDYRHDGKRWLSRVPFVLHHTMWEHQPGVGTVNRITVLRRYQLPP